MLGPLGPPGKLPLLSVFATRQQYNGPRSYHEEAACTLLTTATPGNTSGSS